MQRLDLLVVTLILNFRKVSYNLRHNNVAGVDNYTLKMANINDNWKLTPPCINCIAKLCNKDEGTYMCISCL